MRDKVFDTPQDQIVDFAFNQQVVDVFPDMIRRSVPGYETVVPMIGLMAARHLSSQGLALDFGCSLGAVGLATLAQNPSPDIRVVGIDSSAAMIDKARTLASDSRAEFVHQDVRDYVVDGADVVIMNLLLQFLEPAERLTLLTRIHASMNPGGLLILTEKVRHDDHSLHEFYDQTHLAWKRANGYSELEVSQKRAALENVMRIDSEPMHLERLGTAGFTQIAQWYRCLNWAAFLAYKT